MIRTEENSLNRKVSVLMGVHNCADTLKEAIDSIISQTYYDWELVLCDDGSKDDTFKIAKEYEKIDPRIIVIKNQINEGLNKTLNRCLSLASGRYVARMDGDDISLPERFQTQVDFLESQNKYDIVSSAMTFFDENGDWGRNYVKEFPSKEDIIAGSPICHAPVMMKKKCLDDVHGYTENNRMLRVEDVNLWIKLYAKGYRCYNIQETLYRMRNDKNALYRRKYKYRINSTYVRLLGCRMLQLGPVSYLQAFKPMVYGLVPAKLRYIIRKANSNKGYA